MVLETGRDVFSLLQDPLRRQLVHEGVEAPSRIQSLAIPPVLMGKNLLLVAPTGTGKTHAAILPVLDMFLSLRAREKTLGISILYVTPLRALNRDLLRRLIEIGKALDIDIQVRHGDTSQKARTNQAKHPPDMLITTPETLQAILPGRRMRQHLRSVRWVVVDEIHELATDKRGVQLSVALERLRNLTERDFQRIGLSATVGETEKIAQFLAGTGREVNLVKTGETKRMEVSIEYLAPSRTDREDAERLGLPPPSVARVRRICDLISKERSSLVFTNTREHAEALASQIRAICVDASVNVHHGSLSREIREEVEEKFQKGEVRAVICTSSLELGIDIGSVDFIIQYMSPRQAVRLIQRIGRSGHKVEAIPRGTILAGWPDDILESAVILKRAQEELLEPIRTHDKALDVLAHQIVGLVLDLKAVKIDEILDTVRRAYPYRDLDPEDLMQVVQQLRDEKIIRVEEEMLRPRFPRAFSYYFENLSTIPDVKQFTVFDFLGRRRIGVLDQEFVAKRCRSGVEFIMHGHTWKVIAINEEKKSVEVEPTAPTLNAIPSWEGEIIPVEYEVANEVGRLRSQIQSCLTDEEKLKALAKDFRIHHEAMKKVAEAIRSHSREFVVPTHDTVLIERYEHCIVIHCCFGNLVNETIAIVLAVLLSAKYGANVATQVDPYRIALICPVKIEPTTVADELKRLTPDDLEAILGEIIEDTGLFAWRQWQVARRFGAVERKVEYKSTRARLLVRLFRGGPINREAKREVSIEKLDLEKAKLTIQRIGQGEIAVQVSSQKGMSCSTLALPAIDKIVPHDLLQPAIPTRPIVDIIRERLLSATVRLVCVFNADWEGIRNVEDLKDPIRCPKCRSTLVAATYRNDDQLLRVSKKRKLKRQLTAEEEQIWDKGWSSASLVQTAGRRAVIAMSGRGVGPMVARRILRRLHRNEDEFFVDILKAEREYARTRLFWD